MESKWTLENSIIWKTLIKLQRCILIICNAMSVLFIVYSVVLRYITKSDLFGLEEIMVIVAMWMYFMGAAYGSYEGSHISADILSEYVKNTRAKSILKIVETSLSTVVAAVFTYWCFEFVMWNLGKGAKSSGLKIPLITSQSAIILGFVLMLIYCVYHLVKSVKALNSTNSKHEEEEPWNC